MIAGLEGAIAAWRVALGPGGVSIDPEDVAASNRATYASTHSILAILSPMSVAQVQDCLLIATRFRAPVYPISRGCNWGYGSRLPARGAAVLLSLAGMNRVLAVDEALGRVRVEPGVTFLQLGRRLAEAGSRLLAPWTGSGPHTSLVGNVLERGIGKGLYEDMAAHACGFEVVLPTGVVVQTGPGETAAIAGASRVGSGPGVQDLFVQSNLGVVTAMDFWLQEGPALRQLVWARLGAAAVAGCIDRLRPVLQRGDPWFRPELVSAYRAGTQGSAAAGPGSGGDWIAVVTVWGDTQADLALRRERAAALLHASGGTAPGVGGIEDGRLSGMDAEWVGGEGLRGAYAAKPGGMPADPDPDRDRCGVVWIAPALPMQGEVVAGAVGAIGAVLARHGFGPALSLRAADGRTVRAVVGLFYDRDEPGGDARAAGCAAAVHAWMRANGLAAYRLGIAEMAERAEEPGRDTLLRAVKAAVDPAGILAPGRYIG